jgi:hypothetical protein
VNRPFQVHKGGQNFIGTHDEPIAVAMRVHDPKYSPFETES